MALLSHVVPKNEIAGKLKKNIFGVKFHFFRVMSNTRRIGNKKFYEKYSL